MWSARCASPETKNVKRLLILSGHHDSALEIPGFVSLVTDSLSSQPPGFIGLITMLVMSLIQLTG